MLALRKRGLSEKISKLLLDGCSTIDVLNNWLPPLEYGGIDILNIKDIKNPPNYGIRNRVNTSTGRGIMS